MKYKLMWVDLHLCGRREAVSVGCGTGWVDDVVCSASSSWVPNELAVGGGQVGDMAMSVGDRWGDAANSRWVVDNMMCLASSSLVPNELAVGRGQVGDVAMSG